MCFQVLADRFGFSCFGLHWLIDDLLTKLNVSRF